MHDSIERVCAKHVTKRRGVANVALNQSAPAYEFAMPERQIVKHDAVVPFCSESLGAVAADVTGTSGDQNASHRRRPSARGAKLEPNFFAAAIRLVSPPRF